MNPITALPRPSGVAPGPWERGAIETCGPGESATIPVPSNR